MFENIGKKIKTLAKVLCWVGIVISIIYAIALFLIAMDSYDEETFIIMGIVTLIVGPLTSWISSFFMYGFGELIDKASDIEKKINAQNPTRNLGE